MCSVPDCVHNIQIGHARLHHHHIGAFRCRKHPKSGARGCTGLASTRSEAKDNSTNVERHFPQSFGPIGRIHLVVRLVTFGHPHGTRSYSITERPVEC